MEAGPVVSDDELMGVALLAIPAGGLIVLAARFGGGFTGWPVAGAALLAVIGGLLVLTVARPAVGRVVGGRAVDVTGHAHGPGLIEVHEAGHVAAARALGGRVRSAEVWAGGGLVRAVLPDSSPQTAVTFLLAGKRAAGTSTGASADDAEIRRELRGVPNAGAVYRAADSRARSIVSSRRGQIERDAATLKARRRL